MGGVEQPPSINLKAAHQFMNTRRNVLTAENYVEGILRGDRTILSKAITLIESALPAHQSLAQEIIGQSLPFSGNSIRIGITGVPGVGKSSFIESFGRFLTQSGHRIAVLAIDPSSSRSKGSILGDKTRMEELATDPNAFIRPSPSSGSLGGVARKTRETIILCEAAGFNVIVVETVGVGQSEIAVHSMVDFFLLLMIAGAGDELQGIKRGIMEMADAILINKADGDNLPKINITLAELRNALHFFHPSESGWIPVAGSCSARTRNGIPEAWQTISEYVEFAKGNGYFNKRRLEQARNTMHISIEESLSNHFFQTAEIKKQLKKLNESLTKMEISEYAAAQMLLNIYFKRK
ncbi:MAG: methylmalonyl Co-A mutase-associated GTPase MeaB [Bacteroidetes bacterium]|nr:methylmalonyl Co-A mutase-associated GTPase MeaB [Bacteroidota bacterium]